MLENLIFVFIVFMFIIGGMVFIMVVDAVVHAFFGFSFLTVVEKFLFDKFGR